ncbi:hypothetical protein SAMN02927903_02170 [Flavobacterium caeni]|uniref:Uncharacterized protein n=1 Tax=Flavobacterium caeni TaxID=490189 RepID=A0A1G5I8R0_9FLAO|nr:hypothetical protein SAMN02927903_02170 [Flavobacterium caeni]
MKWTIVWLMALALLASCGPHRMKCGPRGICEKNAPAPTIG